MVLSGVISGFCFFSNGDHVVQPLNNKQELANKAPLVKVFNDEAISKSILFVRLQLY